MGSRRILATALRGGVSWQTRRQVPTVVGRHGQWVTPVGQQPRLAQPSGSYHSILAREHRLVMTNAATVHLGCTVLQLLVGSCSGDMLSRAVEGLMYASDSTLSASQGIALL